MKEFKVNKYLLDFFDNQQFDLDSINKLIQKLDIADFETYLSDYNIEERRVMYKLVKEFFETKESRNFILELFRKRIKQDQEDIITFIMLFIFLENSNEKEIKSLLGDDLPVFHELYFTIALSNTEFEFHNAIGNSLSSVVKKKIIQYVKNKDIKKIYKVHTREFLDYLNKSDAIEIFSRKGINLIRFILENINNVYEYDYWYNFAFKFKLSDEPDVLKCVSNAVYYLLSDPNLDSYEEPLFKMGFFEYLTKEDIEILIEESRLRFYELLEKELKSWDTYSDGKKHLSKFLEEKNIDIVALIVNIIRGCKYKDYLTLWEYWAWRYIEIEDLKELIEDTDVNFLETLLCMSYDVIILKNTKLEDNHTELNELLPKRYFSNAKELMEGKLIEIIKKKEMETFVPLFAHGLLFNLDVERISSLIEDREIDLLDLVFQVLNGYYSDLYNFFDEFFDHIIDNWFKKLKKIEFQDFEVKILKEIVNTIETNYLKAKDYYSYIYFEFNDLKVKLQRIVQEKENKGSELNVEKLLQLVFKATEGQDDILNGAVGSNGYGFVFANLADISRLLSWTPSSKAFSVMNYNSEMDAYLGAIQAIEFAGAIKTLIPSIELGGDEILYDVWMLVKTPDNKLFPARFYYGASGTSIAGYRQTLNTIKENESSHHWPKDFSSRINFSPFQFLKDERIQFIEALKHALKKIPISYFKGVYSHDLGKTLMGYDENGHILREIKRNNENFNIL